MRFFYIVKEAFAGLSHARMSCFISISTVTFLLFLMGIIGVITLNVNHLVDVLNARIDIQVFISDTLDDRQIATLSARLMALDEVENIEYISKEAAALEFQKEFGRDLFSILEENPLPSSFTVKLKEKFRTQDEIKKIATTIELEPGIDEVVYHSQALGMLTRFSRIATIINILLFSLVSFGSLFIISNTIRLVIIARQATIHTLKLVGATAAFIRGPFLLEGVIQGCIGGLAAFALTYLLVYLFNFQWPGVIEITPHILVLLVPVGVSFGFFASLFAVKRFLVF